MRRVSEAFHTRLTSEMLPSKYKEDHKRMIENVQKVEKVMTSLKPNGTIVADGSIFIFDQQ